MTEDTDSPSPVKLYLCGSRFFSNGARSTTLLCDEISARQKSEAEVALLKSKLRRAVEIAEEFKIAFKEENHFRKGCDCGLCELAEELASIKETLPETK
jgi:hypothetical protein